MGGSISALFKFLKHPSAYRPEILVIYICGLFYVLSENEWILFLHVKCCFWLFLDVLKLVWNMLKNMNKDWYLDFPRRQKKGQKSVQLVFNFRNCPSKNCWSKICIEFFIVFIYYSWLKMFDFILAFAMCVCSIKGLA